MVQRTVHGQDYLIDYYALLGISRNASKEQVRKAYRGKQMQYHPDRFQGLAPELLQQAEQRCNLYNEAYAVLGEPTKKSEYDEMLQGWTKPISTNGVPIYSFGEGGFSFGSLLENLAANPEAREAEAEKLALEFSQFDKATYDLITKMVDVGVELSPELRAAYLEQLERRDLYLSLRSGFVWDSMGMKNHAPDPKLEYVEQMEAMLAETRREAMERVEQQVLLLTAGEQTLLLPQPSGEAAVEPRQMLAHYQARLDEHFAQQAAILKPLAEEREQVLSKRFELASEIAYHPETTVYTANLIIEMKAIDGSSHWFPMAFSDGSASVQGMAVEGMEALTDPAVVREWMQRGYTFVSFKVINQIDYLSQLEHIVNMHGDRLEEQAEKTASG